MGGPGFTESPTAQGKGGRGFTKPHTAHGRGGPGFTQTDSTVIRAPPVARTHAHNQRQYTWQRSTQTHNNRVQHAAQSRRLAIMWTRRIAASYAKSRSAPRPGREAIFLTKRDTTFPSRRSKQQKTGISCAQQCGQNRGTRANGAPANAHAHHAENRSHDPQTHTRAPPGARPPMQAIRAVSPAGRQRPRPAPGAGSTGRARPGSRVGTRGGR